MSPRSHFADYAKRYPKQYEAFSDSMWNGFVSITHTIGLGKFFSFTPAHSVIDDPISDGEAVGKALAEIYLEAQPENGGGFRPGF
jgi:hypothetical protein